MGLSPQWREFPAADYDALTAGPGLSLSVEARAKSHNGCTLPCGDHVVLARAHRQLAQPVQPGELPQSREIRARVLRVGRQRRHRHQADDGHRTALEERRKLVRIEPGLARLTG